MARKPEAESVDSEVRPDLPQAREPEREAEKQRLVRKTPKSDRARAQLWTRIDKAKASSTARYHDVVAALYRKTSREAVRRLAVSSDPGSGELTDRVELIDEFAKLSPGQIRAVLDNLFDDALWDSAFFDVSRTTVLDSLGLFDWKLLTVEELLEIDEPRIWERVRSVVGSVQHGQHSAIEAVMVDALGEGHTVRETARAIRQVTAGMEAVEAMRVARTETTLHWNGATLTTMGELEVKRKQWLSSRDEKVRPTHQTADTQIKLVGEDFEVGTATGLHPGVMSEYKENVNCRCAMIPVLEDLVG